MAELRRIALWGLAGFVAIGAFAALLTAPLFTFAIMDFITGGPCKSEFVKEFSSPDKLTIVVSVVNCGATTDYTTRAAFKGEPDGSYFFMVQGENKIDVIWTDKFAPKGFEPTIVYEPPKRVWRKAIVWGSVEISYREGYSEPGGKHQSVEPNAPDR